MIKSSRFSADDEKEKDFKFSLFGKVQNNEKDKRTLSLGQPSKCFNLKTIDGTLKKGYGMQDFAMPESEDDVENESVVAVRGEKIKTIWKLKWYDNFLKKNRYYLFYFNDEAIICFDNMFEFRPETYVIPTEYVDTPYATHYRKDQQDAILLSGEGGNLMVVTGDAIFKSENAPRIISCCNHYGKLFAITANARGTLVYNEDSNVLEWNDEKTKDLDFSDERGDLNKIISFNDYLYIFRDFGITEISEYGSEGDFAISHIYQSTAFIHPNTIAQAGEKIFFLEGERIKEFNGNSVKDVDLDCIGILKGISQRHAFGACFDGKYYLACRANFDDGKVVGCEGSDKGYDNNILLVYSINEGHADILRGIDINEMVALTNKFKSKMVFCFNNDYVGKLGQLSENGEVFGERVDGLWQSGITDFDMPGKMKRLQYFSIQSEGDCLVTISSENESKTFNVKGKKDVQKIVANILGKQFEVKIETKESEVVNISELTLTVSVRQ